jgi:hypothetical protein
MEVNMLGISVRAARVVTAAPASRKIVRSVALIGALLLAAVAVNVLIVVADIRAHAVPSASEDLGPSICQARAPAQLLQHPFRGALAPCSTCVAPHG